MKSTARLVCFLTVLTISSLASADVIVNYSVDLGGGNNDPLNGLAARATFSTDGDQFTILLENTSTGVPSSFDTADSLLVSLGMNLPEGVMILSGDAALIGPDSVGLGRWSDRGPGDGVGEEWIWTNDFGGDFMETFAQVISTSSGQGDGTVTRFGGGSGNVDGPFGGIAADPPILEIPETQRGVSDSIQFELTLTAPLTEAQLTEIANTSIVEFGSDQRYLGVPEPISLILLLAGIPLLAHRS
jgi:hypothetical protein